MSGTYLCVGVTSGGPRVSLPRDRVRRCTLVCLKCVTTAHARARCARVVVHRSVARPGPDVARERDRERDTGREKQRGPVVAARPAGTQLRAGGRAESVEGERAPFAPSRRCTLHAALRHVDRARGGDGGRGSETEEEERAVCILPRVTRAS